MMDRDFFDSVSGSGDCEADRHSLSVVYDRPWRTLFRKRYALCCWHCDLWLPEPSRLCGGWSYGSGHGIMAPPGPAGLRQGS
jgi:hypothetical protein